MSDNARFVKMDRIVNSCLMDLGETEARYEQFLHWGLKMVEEITLDGYYGIVGVELPLNKNTYSICLPSDCIEWVLFATRIDVDVYVFVQDQKLVANFQTLQKQGELMNAMQNSISKQGYLHWSNILGIQGEDLGRQFGMKIKGNYAGYFREDKQTGNIYFKPLLTNTDTIYMEYISDCSLNQSETLVPRNATRLIEAFIHWQRYEYSLDKTMDSVRQANRKRMLFDEEMAKFEARENDLSLEDIMDVYYDAYSLSPNY